MRDDDGRVLVPGFYDDVTPLTSVEQSALEAIPSVEASLKRDLGLAQSEQPGRTLFAGFTLPTLNINGIAAAEVGAQAANLIPNFARATLDLRLVAGNNAQRTPMDAPLARAVVAAVQSTVDYPLVLQPTLGGTLPLIVIEQMLGAQLVTVPIANADNNQHAENENVQVQFLWDGIDSYAPLMTRL